MRRFFQLLIVTLLAAPAIAAQAGVQELLDAGIPVKCGTPYILEALSAQKVAKVAARPTMQYNLFIPGGHFRVHYNTTAAIDNVDSTDASHNGVPDYVDSCMVYLETAYTRLVTELRFDPPLSDNSAGGGPELDVYLRNLSGVYGQTFTAAPINSWTSAAYMELENDYSESIFPTKGLPALKVTTAHEFFHAIQFRYYYPSDVNWWQEQSAVWAENYIWNEVDDYFYYLRYFYTFKGTVGGYTYTGRETPLDTRNGSYEYGATVWAMFLAKKHGPGIILDIWLRLRDNHAYSITEFDSVIPGGLANALGEFAVWNYFTKTRGNGTDFLYDSPSFPVMIASDDSSSTNPAEGTKSAKRLTSKYVEFLFAGAWQATDQLHVSVTPSGSSSGSFANTLVLYNSPTNYRIHTLTSGTNTVSLNGVWNRAILVTACANTSGTSSFGYTFSTEVITEAEEPEPSPFVLKGTYPNPFNPATTVDFSVPDAGGHVAVKVYNALGQETAVLFNGMLEGGEKQIIWQPETNLAGGVYFVKIESPWGIKTAKMLFMK